MTTNICSFNAKGLGSKQKREQIFACLKAQDYSICLLQETHLKQSNEHIWRSEWGGEAFLVEIARRKRALEFLSIISFLKY